MKKNELNRALAALMRSLAGRSFSISYDLDTKLVDEAKRDGRDVYGEVTKLIIAKGFKYRTLHNVFTARGITKPAARTKFEAVKEELRAAKLAKFFTGIAFFERLTVSKEL